MMLLDMHKIKISIKGTEKDFFLFCYQIDIPKLMSEKQVK